MRVSRRITAALLAAAILSLAACGGGGGGGGGGGNSVVPPDTTPDAFAFTDQTGVALSAPVTSAPVTITGIDAASPVAVSGGAYSIGCTSTYVTAPGSVNPNQQVCVRHTSAASASTNTDTVLTVGGVSDTFTSTTSATNAQDTTPDAFTFIDQTGVALSAQVTSAPVTITGIDAASPVSVSGGAYSVGCAIYTTAPGSVNPNQMVCVHHTSAATNSASVNTTLTVGGISDTFTSTTGPAGPADTIPDQFSFTDKTNVDLSTQVISAPVTITGINTPSPISVSGGAYSVGCAIYTTAPGSVTSGQPVCVRHTSAATEGTDTNTTLTVGGVSDTFTSTTLSADTSIRLQSVFPALRFSRPVAMEQAPRDASRWFVAEQGGVIRVFDNDDNVASTAVFLDISGRVGDSSGETGLLGMAFDPAFASNGRVFVNYTRSSPSLTSYISRFTSSDGGITLDSSSEVVLLTLPQPYANHNGGQLAFGPDGFLYVAFGDGGSGNDPDNRAQDTSNLWGKILRINVAAVPYTIPPGNPFAGNARCDTGTGTAACPEIFAWGLRNPWKFSFDRATGDLYAGDVGQSAWEEVDLIENGNNYGWRIREGAHCNIPPVNCPTAGLTDPIVDYDRTVGQTITGGYVYRGSAIASLVGSYIFGDFGSGRIFRLPNGRPPLQELLDTSYAIVSFAQDNAGELYVLNFNQGAIFQIQPVGP